MQNNRKPMPLERHIRKVHWNQEIKASNSLDINIHYYIIDKKYALAPPITGRANMGQTITWNVDDQFQWGIMGPGGHSSLKIQWFYWTPRDGITSLGYTKIYAEMNRYFYWTSRHGVHVLLVYGWVRERCEFIKYMFTIALQHLRLPPLSTLML